MSVLLITFVLITWSLPPKGKSSGTSAASWWQAGPAGGQFREATEVESHTLSLVSHTQWYRTQSGIVYYGCNSDYCGLNRHYCIQSKVAPCVGRTLHSGKIEQTQQCGSKDRPNLVWRTQWYIIGTQWYCRKHSQRGICHVLLHTPGSAAVRLFQVSLARTEHCTGNLLSEALEVSGFADFLQVTAAV